MTTLISMSQSTRTVLGNILTEAAQSGRLSLIEQEQAIHYLSTYPVLVEALEKAFDQSVARSDTRRKWTSGDQVTHEAVKAALALAKKGAP